VAGGTAVILRLHAAPDATPLNGRDADRHYHCYANWTGPAEDETNRSSMALNFVSDIDQVPVGSAFGPEKYKRLVALKDECDPSNVFRLNQNIRPPA